MGKHRARIRELNDILRTAFIGGKVLMTQSIASLPAETKASILERVMTFDAFTKDNDPYGQHDFGSFEIAGETILWKIDYYDEDCVYGSGDPADPSKTTRVLTIMFACEY